MEDSCIRRFNRAKRVQTFGQDNAADFEPGSKTTALFGQLVPLIVKLNAANVGQLRSPVGKPALMEALSVDFKAISRTSRSIRIDEPAFDPAPYRHPSAVAEMDFTTHADSLLKLLEDNTQPVAQGGDTPAQLTAKAALRGKFVAYELPADFVTHLRADRNALDHCNAGKHSDNQEGVESTSAIETLLSQAQGIITRLDAAIQNKYSHNPDKLVAWKSASHVERPAKKSQPPAATTPHPVA